MRAAYLREQHRELETKVTTLQGDREDARDDVGKGARRVVGAAAFAVAGSATAFVGGERWYHADGTFGVIPEFTKPLTEPKLTNWNGFTRVKPAIMGGLVAGGFAAWGAAKLTGMVMRDKMSDTITAKQRVIDDQLADAKQGQATIARELTELGEPLAATTPAP